MLAIAFALGIFIGVTFGYLFGFLRRSAQMAMVERLISQADIEWQRQEADE